MFAKPGINNDELMNGMRKFLNEVNSSIGKFVFHGRQKDILKDFEIFVFLEFSRYSNEVPSSSAKLALNWNCHYSTGVLDLDMISDETSSIFLIEENTPTLVTSWIARRHGIWHLLGHLAYQIV